MQGGPSTHTRTYTHTTLHRIASHHIAEREGGGMIAPSAGAAAEVREKIAEQDEEQDGGEEVIWHVKR